MRSLRLVASILAAMSGAPAWAGSPDEVCKAIADQANRDGPSLGEKNLYAASDAVTALLPRTMRYLEPKPLQEADLAEFRGCSSSDCTDGLAEDGDTVWSNLLVDTRPASKQVFLFTEHSGHDREDSLIAVEQSPEGAWIKTFETSDALDDSGFKILLHGSRPYVVVPPGTAFFVDEGGFNPKQTEELYLIVEDPTATKANRCTINYSLAARLSVSEAWSRLYQVIPSGPSHSAIVQFLDKKLQAIASQTGFDEAQGSRVFVDHSLVEPGTSSSELRDIDRFLASPWSPAAREDAMRSIVENVMATNDWEDIEANIKPEEWESRWFPVGIGGHAYLGLLQGFSGTFPTRGPHYFNESLVVLFALDNNALRPIAAYELQDVYRFSGAQFQPLADGMLP